MHPSENIPSALPPARELDQQSPPLPIPQLSPQDSAVDPTTGYRFPQVIDSTILSCFTSCEMKFFYEYVLCLGSPYVSSDLHAGACFARAIEVARRAYWFEGLSSDQAQIKAFKAFTLAWGEQECEFGEQKDFVNTASAMFDYFRQYPLESDPIKPYMIGGDRPAIEFSFAIPLNILHPVTNEPILYGGRIDLVGHYNNFISVVDEKTTKALGQNWEKQWPMRGQFIGYVWALRQYGIVARAALIRGVAIQKTQFSHLQALVMVDEWKMREWYQDMRARVQEMKAMFEDLIQSRRNVKKAWGDACTSYGGCRNMDLCLSQDPSIWFDTYPRRIWNPLNRNPLEVK